MKGKILLLDVDKFAALVENNSFFNAIVSKVLDGDLQKKTLLNRGLATTFGFTMGICL